MVFDLSQYGETRVAVLGATGMLGRAVCARLESVGARVTRLSLSAGFDARERAWLPDRLAGHAACFCLAGWNGGIATNLMSPLRVYANNAQIAVNAVEACAAAGVEFLGVVASCGYPESDDGFLEERTYLTGRPHPSVACHGVAKRAMLEACRFAAAEYPAGVFRTVCLPTLFGPGDHYEGGRTKVVGAMVKRMCDAAAAGADRVVCWGTGEPLRDVMCVADAAELVLAARLAAWDGEWPLNLSAGQEYSVRKIAETAAAAAGFAGRIEWDETKPDGQYRKKLDATRAARVLGPFRATPFAAALYVAAADYRRRFLGGR